MNTGRGEREVEGRGLAPTHKYAKWNPRSRWNSLPSSYKRQGSEHRLYYTALDQPLPNTPLLKWPSICLSRAPKGEGVLKGTKQDSAADNVGTDEGV